jgi:hypothetical protein
MDANKSAAMGYGLRAVYQVGFFDDKLVTMPLFPKRVGGKKVGVMPPLFVVFSALSV